MLNFYLPYIPNAGNVWYVNVPHNIECGRFFVVREILYLSTCEIFIWCSKLFSLTSGIFSALVMDKMYLLAYEIQVKITTV